MQMQFRTIGEMQPPEVQVEVDPAQLVELIRSARAQGEVLYLSNDEGWSQRIDARLTVVYCPSMGVEISAYRGEMIDKPYVELHAYPDGRVTVAHDYLPWTTALGMEQYHNLRVVTGATREELPDVDHVEWAA